MEKKRDFDTAIKDFRSNAEDLWRAEQGSVEYVLHVWHDMSWSEFFSWLAGALALVVIVFSALLFGSLSFR